MSARILFIALSFVCAVSVVDATDTPGRTLVHAGALFDSNTGRMRGPSTVVIQGERIVAVEDGHTGPAAGDSVIDLRGSSVLPGLIDLHTHLTSELSPERYAEGFRLNPGDFALRSTVYAKRTLHAGFTTVRDLGDSDNLSVSLRNAINHGWIEGPRIFTSAKSLATTGGHADPTNSTRGTIMGDPGPKEGVINGPEDAAKAVRQRYKDGADLIKITATGGVLSVAASGENAQFTDEEVTAVVAIARDYGFRVAAHAHGKAGMLRAIRAGATSIEHGTYMDAEVMREMRRHGTWYVPTLMAGWWVAEMAKDPDYFLEVVRGKALSIGPELQKTFAEAHRAGVKIAFGTDSGVSPHGMNGKEFELMVAAGMPPAATLRSATALAAEVLGQSQHLGSVTAGKYADLVAVQGNPLEDITLLQQVTFVMKGGQVVKSVGRD